MPAGTFSRADAESRRYFESLLPEDTQISLRPMFGNLAAFVNGHMFAGVFGAAVFVRLDEDERAALLREPGTGVFEPMAGRPMKEYVQLPDGWSRSPARARAWVERSSARVAGLAPKAARPAAGAARKKPRR
jgi:TfoX/Sxy family transcriptional regulator of competence genes